MKSVIVATVLFASLSSLAGQHAYKAVLGPIKLSNACITDTEVQSINPEKYCTKTETVVVGNPNGDGTAYTETKCVAYDYASVKRSRSFQTKECAEYSNPNSDASSFCVRYKTVNRFMPATIKVTVSTNQGDGTSYKTYNHTFPRCN